MIVVILPRDSWCHEIANVVLIYHLIPPEVLALVYYFQIF